MLSSCSSSLFHSPPAVIAAAVAVAVASTALTEEAVQKPA